MTDFGFKDVGIHIRRVNALDIGGGEEGVLEVIKGLGECDKELACVLPIMELEAAAGGICA